jgi:predicted transcriptional regulator
MLPRSRKLAPSPLQNSILRLLEEAGEEDMRTIHASVDSGSDQVASEIAALEKIGLVQRSVAYGWPALRLTEKGRASVAN